ncbi:MAG: VacJ family lipoprotein [Gallionella sp.]
MNLFRILILISSLALTACGSVPNKNPADPFESFNRGVYSFNDKVDKGLAKPLAKGYHAVMPDTGKIMVSNFFSNLDDVLVTFNDLLQFKLKQGFSDGMRVLVNTTIGIGGLVDVASDRLPKHNEDFGQTLGYWGFGDGPYLVLPFLGSSTLRDTLGLYPDSLASPISNTQHIPTRNQMILTKAINRRAQLLENEKLLDEAALDRYQFLRDSYLANRKNLVYDGNPPREKYEEYEDEIEPVSGVAVVPAGVK